MRCRSCGNYSNFDSFLLAASDAKIESKKAEMSVEKSLFDLPWQFSDALEELSREKINKNLENVFVM